VQWLAYLPLDPRSWVQTRPRTMDFKDVKIRSTHYFKLPLNCDVQNIKLILLKCQSSGCNFGREEGRQRLATSATSISQRYGTTNPRDLLGQSRSSYAIQFLKPPPIHVIFWANHKAAIPYNFQDKKNSSHLWKRVSKVVGGGCSSELISALFVKRFEISCLLCETVRFYFVIY
jgi:hypothetical protein